MDAFCRTITADGLSREFYIGLGIKQPSCSINEDYRHALEEMQRELTGERTILNAIVAELISHFAFKI